MQLSNEVLASLNELCSIPRTDRETGKGGEKGTDRMLKEKYHKYSPQIPPHHFFPINSCHQQRVAVNMLCIFYVFLKPVLSRCCFRECRLKDRIAVTYLVFPADEVWVFDCSVTAHSFSTGGAFPCLFPSCLKNTLAYRAHPTHGGSSYLSRAFNI